MESTAPVPPKEPTTNDQAQQTAPVPEQSSTEANIQSLGADSPQSLQQSQAPSPAMPWDKAEGNSQPNNSNQSTTVLGAAQVQTSRGSNAKRKKILLTITGVLAGIVLLGGGIAAAYVGIIVPNKPENVLKTAIVNTAQEKQISLNGVVDTKAVDPTKENAEPASKIIFSTKSNADKKQAEATIKLTMSGIDFPLDARYVDGNVYVKLGDLKTVMSLISGYAGDALGFDSSELDPLIANVSNLVSNQWIEFDSTLLNTAGASCVTDTDFTLTDQDIQLLEDQYITNPFATITSHSEDTVDGKTATKFEITIDDNKAAGYLGNKKLQDLSFVKTLKKCQAFSKDFNQNTKSLADGDMTPLTIWVDKDTKRISKIASHSTKQDAQKSNMQATIESTISYGSVSVQKPENATPMMQVWSELQQEFTKVFGNSSDDILPDDSAIDIDYPYNSVPQ